MKKNILVQTGTRTETRTRVIPPEIAINENGEETVVREAYEEEYTVEVPVMEAQNVEMTAEEIAELEAMEPPNVDPTPEERLEALEAAMIDMILGGTE